MKNGRCVIRRLNRGRSFSRRCLTRWTSKPDSNPFKAWLSLKKLIWMPVLFGAANPPDDAKGHVYLLNSTDAD